MKLWQLINPQTKEHLSGLQELPENWGPIFGLHGVKDRLGDLSWIGITVRAWIEVDVPDAVIDKKTFIDNQIAQYVKESELMLNNDSITKGEKAAWIEYIRKLNEISLQTGYPNDVYWPAKP